MGVIVTRPPQIQASIDDPTIGVPSKVRASARWLAATRQLFLEHLPAALVLLALCSLVGISIYELRSVRSSLQEINGILEPATRAASDLQFALSKEAASTRAFLLTGNGQYRAEFEDARAARREALAQLTTLSSQTRSEMDIQDVLARAAADLSVADRWLDGLYSQRITRSAYLDEFPRQHRRFTSVTASAATLHQRLRAKATADRQAIETTQRRGKLLELAGVFLAIAASAAVLRLKGRERAARIASESAHADAEMGRAQLETMTARWMRLIRGFSHDVKNPLNAVDGYLFMLERGMMTPLSAAQMQAIAKCRHGVRTAVALTEDLVGLARAETAVVDVRRIDMNVCDMVATVVEDYRAQALSNGLALTIALPPAAEYVHSDPVRVTQILANLVSNAVKYTGTGTIAVAVGRRSDAAGNPCIAIDVADTGPGIPTEDQRRIFEEFEQLDSDAPRGTGIGLAISERLARTLGGAITLVSEVGNGSTFTLRLPLTRVQ